MNDEFNKAIEQIRAVRLTDGEKQAMKARIFAAPAVRPLRVKSLWSMHSFSAWIEHTRAGHITLAVILILLAGGGAAFGAERSLPGDTLYPMKVAVMEPVRLALAVSAQSRAFLAAQFVQERVREGEALAAQGKLDKATQVELSENIARHTTDLNNALTQVAALDLKAAGDISSEYRGEMARRAEEFNALVHPQTMASMTAEVAPPSTTAVMMSAKMSTNTAEGSAPAPAAAPALAPARAPAADQAEITAPDRGPVGELVESIRASGEAVSSWILP